MTGKSGDGSRDGEACVYTDGAASGNPGPGGWAAVLLFPDDRVTEIAGGEPHTTNNRMELTAAREALRTLRSHSGPIRLFTDSTYVLKGVTAWVFGWQRNGWKTSAGDPVANQDLWEDLLEELAHRRGRPPIQWAQVRGHAGVPENERADILAVAHTRGETPQLFAGSKTDYAHVIEASTRRRRGRASAGTGDGSTATRAGARAARGTAEHGSRPASGRRASRPHSYLSLVDGHPRRHATWEACERRVRGQAHARFRKAMSAAEEREILERWGIDPGAVQDD